jgi:hypothetical protein
VRDFQTQLYKTCGVRTVVFIAYNKEDGTQDGTPQVGMYVLRQGSCTVIDRSILGMIGTPVSMTE